MIQPVQPFLNTWGDSPWIEVKDGDVSGRAIFSRHYSKYHYKDGRNPALFVGPGFKIVLLTSDATALFVWRKFKDLRNESGINCAIFRNEGIAKASDLIRAADEIAWQRWPSERLYTYVHPGKVEHKRQPGRCFLKAGWRYVKDAHGRNVTTKKSGLYILERRPEWEMMK